MRRNNDRPAGGNRRGRPDRTSAAGAGVARPARRLPEALARLARRYGCILRYGARNQLIYLRSFIMRNFFLIVILFVMHRLWRVILADGPIVGFTLVQMLWYLAVTEAIELSRGRLFQDIQDDVRTGAVVYTLARPYPYPAFEFARWFGGALVRLVPLLAIGFVSALALVGPLPRFAYGISLALPSIVLGLAIGTLWVLLIGLLAFWSEDVTPFYWIYQKVVFIFGGMFLPIDYFPEWLAAISRVLPTAFQAYWPARLAVAPDAAVAMTTYAGQLVWIAGLAGACALLFAAATKRMHAHGG